MTKKFVIVFQSQRGEIKLKSQMRNLFNQSKLIKIWLEIGFLNTSELHLSFNCDRRKVE